MCSEDHPVLLTEGAVSAHKTRQRSIQLMFESFNVPLAYTAMQPVLALYTTGHTTGTHSHSLTVCALLVLFRNCVCVCVCRFGV